jgi:hypothetical protein
VESWRLVWRKALAPRLSAPGLVALRQALLGDDERLLQGATTSPPPLMCVQDWEVEGACPIGFSGWQGDGLRTVGEVVEYFARVCIEVDQALGEPAACRYFLNWFDEQPRAEVRRGLLAEVKRELKRRATLEAPQLKGA